MVRNPFWDIVRNGREKKTMRNILLSLFLLFSLTAALAAPETEFTDPNKPVVVSADSPHIVLKIKSNPATGYSWFLVDYDYQLLSPERHQYIRPSGNLVGAPGFEIWQFAVNADAFRVPQVTKISLQSIRPWTVPVNGRKLKFVVIIHSEKTPALEKKEGQ
ncbi:MAG: protease inhibitor I42 family protein [Coxiella burnetii]|nr:protease inhibitor I42 family protein [Coxiella burnetii]